MAASNTDHSYQWAYLQHTLVSGMLLQLDQTVEDDQLHIVVALLDDQIDVALGGSLESEQST